MFSSDGKAALVTASVNGFGAAGFVIADGTTYTATLGTWALDSANSTATVDITIGSATKNKTITAVGIRDANSNVLCQKAVNFEQTLDEMVYAYKISFTFEDE